MAAFACGAWLSACALHPTSEDAAEFGKTATAGFEVYASAREAEAELSLKRDIENRACAFIRNPGRKIDNKNNYADIYLPVRPLPPIPSKLKEQIEFLQAIVAYSSALSKATNPEAVAKLEKAADGFVTAATGAVSAVATADGGPSPSGLPVVGPAMTLVAHVGVDLIEFELRSRIRRVVEDTEHVLVTGVIKLQGDIESDKAHLRRAYASWRGEKMCTLAAIRSHNGTSGAELYQEYVDADLAARGYLGRIAVLDKAGELLGNLLVAHKALLSEDVDFEAALKRIDALVKDFTALQTALEKAKA